MSDIVERLNKQARALDRLLLRRFDRTSAEAETMTEAAAEITRLRDEVAELIGLPEGFKRLADLPVNFREVFEENTRFREALAFYADEARWTMNSAGITPALDDRGHRARSALDG